jgi:hypothetical protein
MMKRDECFKILARPSPTTIVVTTYSSAVVWLALGERSSTIFRRRDGVFRTRWAWRSAGRQAHHLPAGDGSF